VGVDLGLTLAQGGYEVEYLLLLFRLNFLESLMDVDVVFDSDLFFCFVQT